VTDARHAAEGLLAARAPAFRARAIAGAALLAALLVAAHALRLDDRARAYLELARGAGVAGVFLHVVAYVVAALLGVPLSPLTVAAGATYGPLAGAALGVPSATLGACCAFLVGRVVARDPDAIARGEGRIARAAQAIGRGGLRLVLVLRLAPIVPFSVLNFAFGATPTRLSRFAAGSFVGTIPSQLGYACLGAVLTWPPGPARTRAEVALVVGAALLSLGATAGVLAMVRGPRGGGATRG
jgi:uncharacterized membrane protein YdjX (TVP38/TMEM64 family)